MVKYVLNREELDWIDQGHGFASDTEEPWDDDIADSIISKFREAWNNEIFLNNNRYELDLTHEEVDYIYGIIEDFAFDDFYTQIYRHQEIEGDVSNKDWISYKSTLDLTNSILNKFKKPPLTIERFRKERCSDLEELDQWNEERIRSTCYKLGIPLEPIHLPYLNLLQKLTRAGINISSFLVYSDDKLNQEFDLNLDSQKLDSIRGCFTEIKNNQGLRNKYTSELLRKEIKEGMFNENFLHFLQGQIKQIFC